MPGHNDVKQFVQRNPESARAVLRQLAQAGAITEPEVLYDFGDYWDRHYESDHRLSSYLRYSLAASNEPFRILVMLLTGMHSANFRTNKGSIYRIRFVASGEHSGASTPATKAPAAAAAAASKTSKMVTKSAAYPLVLVCNHHFQNKWSVKDSSEQTKEKLDEEFRQLIEEEMRAVDALDTSDSSSATDTNWMHAHKDGSYVKYKIENNNPYSDGVLEPGVGNEWVHDPNDSGKRQDESRRIMYLQQNAANHLPRF